MHKYEVTVYARGDGDPANNSGGAIVRVRGRSKVLLVLGPDIKPYAVSKQATPYFNWHLSRSQLENLEYYDNIEAVNKNLRNDMPEYIIDQVGLAPKIFNQIPLIGEEYSQVKSGVYKRAIPRN